MVTERPVLKSEGPQSNPVARANLPSSVEIADDSILFRDDFAHFDVAKW